MTEDEIIRMMREAGFTPGRILGTHSLSNFCSESRLLRFGELVAAAERESCAVIAADLGPDSLKYGADCCYDTCADLAKAIRARGNP